MQFSGPVDLSLWPRKKYNYIVLYKRAICRPHKRSPEKMKITRILYSLRLRCKHGRCWGVKSGQHCLTYRHKSRRTFHSIYSCIFLRHLSFVFFFLFLIKCNRSFWLYITAYYYIIIIKCVIYHAFVNMKAILQCAFNRAIFEYWTRWWYNTMFYGIRYKNIRFFLSINALVSYTEYCQPRHNALLFRL